MSRWPDDYVSNVLNDIEELKGSRQVIKAGLVERCAIRFCSPRELHPNPDDEFSMDDIGPNFEIVGNYVKEIHELIRRKEIIFTEPIIVQKMQPEGYLLLNGHHRWFAALRMGIKKVHIQIVNLVSADDVHRMLDNSDNTKRVSFDLDEVLLARDEDERDDIKDSLFSEKIEERLRIGAANLIRDLQDRGYDIWLYSAGYYSEEYINDFLSMYELTAAGIINGFNEKRKTDTEAAKEIRIKMEQKYKQALHIDNESLVCINHESGEFSQFELEDTGNWYESIMKIVDSL